MQAPINHLIPYRLSGAAHAGEWAGNTHSWEPICFCDLTSRQQTVREVARILQPGGWLSAAGINRLAYLRDAFRGRPHQGAEQRAFRIQFLRDGNLDPLRTPQVGHTHLSTSDEFRNLFRDSFDEVILIGVESFTAGRQEILPALSAQDADAWLDLVEQTAKTRDGLGISDHFLYIGRKRA